MEIIYEYKKRKNMVIKVLDSKRILISANTTDKKICDAFINQKMERILKMQAKLKLVEAKKAANALYFLGKPYKVVITLCDTNEASFVEDEVHIKHTKQINPNKLINTFLSDQAHMILNQALKDNLAFFPKLDRPKLVIKKMKSRWGYCKYKEGLVCLNAGLIFTSPTCIQYVVVHELLHFYYQNHQSDFHNHLEIIIKNHRKVEKELKSYGFLLI